LVRGRRRPRPWCRPLVGVAGPELGDHHLVAVDHLVAAGGFDLGDCVAVGGFDLSDHHLVGVDYLDAAGGLDLGVGQWLRDLDLYVCHVGTLVGNGWLAV
jgi:hypothetical protein